MKRLRDRLNNKKGFTLVELIVVIVIILILAAVLVPNVMRYISEARKSTFQNEASSYLTELQGYAAEKYGQSNIGEDIKNDDFAATATGGKYVLTDFDPTSGDDLELEASPYVALGSKGTSGQKAINAEIDKGSVKSFSYSNGIYYIVWTQSGGWGPVNE